MQRIIIIRHSLRNQGILSILIGSRYSSRCRSTMSTFDDHYPLLERETSSTSTDGGSPLTASSSAAAAALRESNSTPYAEQYDLQYESNTRRGKSYRPATPSRNSRSAAKMRMRDDDDDDDVMEDDESSSGQMKGFKSISSTIPPPSGSLIPPAVYAAAAADEGERDEIAALVDEIARGVGSQPQQQGGWLRGRKGIREEERTSSSKLAVGGGDDMREVKTTLVRFDRAGQRISELDKLWKQTKGNSKLFEMMGFHDFENLFNIFISEARLEQASEYNVVVKRVEIAWELYSIMLRRGLLHDLTAKKNGNKAAATKIYYPLLKALAWVGEGYKAQDVLERMEATNVEADGEAISNVIMALTKRRARFQAHEVFQKATARGIPLTMPAKSHLLSCHAFAHDAARSIEVFDAALKDAQMLGPLTPCDVTTKMIKRILEVGIDTCDVDVLRKGLSEAKEPIDRGIGLQVLNVAARRGDGQLATQMFYMLEHWGYTPTASSFNAVIQALGLSNNDASMIRALNEMCYWGFEPSKGTLNLLAHHLCHSVERLDDIYHKLVEMKDAHDRQQEQLSEENGNGQQLAPTSNVLPVASAPVYLIVLGCAYGNQLDRAFATFEDYGPVFGLEHDTAVCNALLLACLRSKSLQVGAAQSVISEMDRLGVEPDQESLHLMVKILIQAREAKEKMEQLLEHMQEKGVEPSPKTLRILAVWNALIGDHARAQEFLVEMESTGTFIPSWFPRRLEQIRENGDTL